MELEAFRRGDRRTLEHVYRTYVERIERIVRYGAVSTRSGWHVGLCGSDVADLVQETFVRAFEQKARLSYDGVRPYLPFLSTIARNLVFNAARRRGREVALELLPEPEAPAAAPHLPWADPANLRAAERYTAALPSELRNVHERRFVLGESQERAARALGLTRQQLRTRERRLRAGLADHLRNQDPGLGVELCAASGNGRP